MAFTVQGIGTTFIGKRDFRPDGSYVTTEWIVFIFIPIFPLRSLRVQEIGYEGSVFYNKEQYKVYERRMPNFKQVLFVYGFIVFCCFWFFLFFRLTDFINRIIEDGFLKDAFYLLMIFAPALIPFLLRVHAKRKVLL